MHQPVLIASSMTSEDLRRHNFNMIGFITTGGGSPLLMSQPTNREVVPTETRDESGQYMLTGRQVMEVPRRDALLPRFGPSGGSRNFFQGGVSLQAAREMELIPYDFRPQSHVLKHSLVVAGIPKHMELVLIPATEIEDDVASQTNAFNDLLHQEEPPVEWVINVEETIGNSEEAPTSMLNHGQINAMVKKLIEVVKDLSLDKEELPKIMITLCGAINIALVTLKING